MIREYDTKFRVIDRIRFFPEVPRAASQRLDTRPRENASEADAGCARARGQSHHPGDLPQTVNAKVTSHSTQGQTADRVLIHVDTDKGEQLVNNRFAYVSVSRAQYDAQIYANDRSELAHDLSRDISRPTATEAQEQEPESHNNEPVATQQKAQEDQNELSQGLGMGLD
jgi:hypothetical protein